MIRNVWRLALVGCALVLVECGGVTQFATLTVKAMPAMIAADGAASTITFTAVDEKGAPGTGTVQVTSTAGSLKGGQDVTLSNGSATVMFTCSASMDAMCSGNVRVSGSWARPTAAAATGSTLVRVGTGGAGGGSGGAGGGNSGGGTGGAGGGNTGGGNVGGGTGGAGGGNTGGGNTGGGTGGAGGGAVSADGGFVVTMAIPRSRIYVGVNDFTDISIALRRTDAGPPIPNRDFTLTATLGGWTDAVDSGAPTPTSPFNANTGASGLGIVRFAETGSTGTASLTATDVLSGTARTTTVEISRIQQISWVGMQCRGTPCSILGVRNSGNEIGVVSFRVTDNLNRPVAGVPVTFSLVNAPGSTMINPTLALTDANGVATSTVSAGPTTGAFTIHAVVIPGQVEGDSVNIGIRGVRPANKSFGINCQFVNMAALQCANPNCPRAFSDTCTITLKDRFNNPVGTGTSVNLKVEAGAVPVSINTVAFMPTGTNTTEGTGTFVYATTGGSNNLPVDVAPLAATAQGVFPPRLAEPSTGSGLIRNPRDGLVSLMAYVTGEEWFSDDNQNGVQDGNEQFVDQGEPFVDSNDNGVRDVGEDYIDLAPPDGGVPNNMWDAPNGRWDPNTTIWSETRLLWTSSAVQVVFSPNTAPFSPASCPGGLPKASSQQILFGAPDVNLNHVQSATTTFTMTRTSSRGTAGVMFPSVLDTLGFGNERRLVSAADQNADCTPATAICVWKILFYDWSAGFSGAYLQLTGPPATDMQPCQNDTITVRSTTLSVTAQNTIQGAWQ